MRRIKFVMSLFTILCLAIAVSILPPNSMPVDNNIRAFNATCVINTPNGAVATGFILDTGYILTAGHAVDLNMNGLISKNERYTKVELRDGTELIARVVCLGKKDFAILEINRHLPWGLTASKREHKFGEEIFTIGAMAGYALHLTDGRISNPTNGFARASCFISGGNSGGAIFAMDGTPLGIVVAVGTRLGYNSFRIPIPIVRNGQRRIMTVSGMVRSVIELSSMCLFIPIGDVRAELVSKNLHSLLDVSPEPALLDSAKTHAECAFRTLFLIYIFMVFIFYVRTHLFN